jgi:hypothetical protein
MLNSSRTGLVSNSHALAFFERIGMTENTIVQMTQEKFKEMLENVVERRDVKNEERRDSVAFL